MDDPRRLFPDDPTLPDVLALIRSAFAYMDGVVDPPSSMHRLTLEDLRTGPGEVWAIGDPVVACAIFTAQTDTLYVGKIAVAPEARDRGMARRLIDAAEARARALGLASLTLQTRVELTANRAAFEALGFRKIAETAHEGFNRPTSFTFEKALRVP